MGMRNFTKKCDSKFDWTEDEQLHKSRRLKILAKHPEIKKFMKKDGDPWIIRQAIILIILHCMLAYIRESIKDRFLDNLYTCLTGSTISTMLMMHLHESVHGLVFGPNSVWKNRIYGLIVNLFLGVPIYALFKRAHIKHHKFIGNEIQDEEYPTELEAQLVPDHISAAKFAWLVLNPIILNFRTPVLAVVKGFVLDVNFVDEILTYATLFAFDFCLICWCDRTDMIAHFAISTFFATSLHMFGFWGVSSHLTYFPEKETNSYKGWMNGLFLNFGYHTVHHDFPNVPSKYLEKIIEIAPEFYEDEFYFDSFYSAIVKFLFDPKMSVGSRLKRRQTPPFY